LNKFRAFMQQNPMVGWGFAAVLMLFAAGMLYMRLTAKTEVAQLTEMVTLRDAETGDTWQLPRGVMEKELYMRAPPIDPNQGLVNPKTGKANGFPVDAWKETVQRINEDVARNDAPAAPSAPPAPKAPGAPSGR
jgi:hypothetical protein